MTRSLWPVLKRHLRGEAPPAPPVVTPLSSPRATPSRLSPEHFLPLRRGRDNCLVLLSSVFPR